MEKIFFDTWESVVRTIVITIMAYALLILLLRASGKRTLSKMNAFDFIVTIALGSTLATVMLNKDVALIDGLISFSLLIGLQYLITWLSARHEKVSNLVKSSPALLVYKGVMLKDIMLKERIAEDEILALLREKGLASVQDADAVVLETEGSLTVITHVENLDTPVISNTIKPKDLRDKSV